MATGNYGTIRPADVSVNDIEILYHYTNKRENTENVTVEYLDPKKILKPVTTPNQGNEILGGMYTLKLPTDTFGAKGFYNIIIRPKQIRTSITDCGVLAGSPDVLGLVFSLDDLPPDVDKTKFHNGELVGYRVEYLSTNIGTAQPKEQNKFTIITSNNLVVPVSENLADTSDKALSYVFTETSSLIFCTVTPSSAPSIKPNALPFIGVKTQDVIITNTYFNPIMLEIEMVEYDDEVLAYALYGNQSKSLEDGIYSIYNFENDIYKQYNLFEIKDKFTGQPLYEVREKRSDIDFNKDFDNLSQI
mgnify:CR=1 FL=1|tara:strand:+ start:109 stop:1017 length:909 start_codon:yes stop_codon:yes gene_type:complete